MVIMVVWWVFSMDHRSFKKIAELIPLGLPLVLSFICLGWYNWARFGSITEAGIYYQFSAMPNYQKYYHEFFNPIFIPQNI